jgi:lipopolysaccharide export system ATP-binding protein
MLGICHHAYILNAGKVIAAGTPEEVLNDQHVRDVYLGSDFRL